MSHVSRSPRQIEDVCALFDEAPLESRWIDALGALASLTGSERAQLVGFCFGETKPFDWISNDAGDLAEQCRRVGGGYDEALNFRVAAAQGARDMSVLDERDYEWAKRGLASDAYLDFCEEAGIPFGCQTTLIRGGEAVVGLAALKTRRDGRTTPEQREAFAAVAPRVLSAVRLQMAIEREGQNLLMGTLEAMTVQAVLLDASGRVCGVTPAADRLLCAGDHRLCLRDGRLEAATALDSRRIARSVQEALQPGGGTPAPVLLSPVADGPALRLSAHRLPARPGAMGLAAAVIVVLEAAKAARGERPVLLVERHGLTPAEADIAMALVQGQSRLRIAERRGVSVATIGTQMKSIYQKMYVRREAELVAKIANTF